MANGTASKYMMNFPRGGKKTLEMVTGIAAGLNYLHGKNITHADLKCDNVLISSNGTPLLADFGMSTRAELTASKNMGTFRFMAPELIYSPDRKDHENSWMTDMWSFGMVVYELISGKMPYYEAGGVLVVGEILRRKIPSKPKFTGEYHEKLWRICLLCWNFEPSQRPTSQAVLDDLISTKSVYESLNNESPEGSFPPERQITNSVPNAGRRLGNTFQNLLHWLTRYK